MITNNKLEKIKGYLGIANRAGYIIWGVDNLDGYTHKLYLVLYRNDAGKTVLKALNRLDDKLPAYEIDVESFKYISSTENSKILGIKNKGLSDQIINLLRGEDGR